VPDPDHSRFRLYCDLENQPTGTNGGLARPFNAFPSYWYNTGPSYLFNQFVNITEPRPSQQSFLFDPNLPTVILLKREIANFNLWHNLMEFMSIKHSLQIIERTLGWADMWKGGSIRDGLHILMLDKEEDGPYQALYKSITPNPVLKFYEFSKLSTSNILLPIPGGANPFWQGDWVDLDCGDSELLTDFRDDLLQHFELTSPAVSTRTRSLTVTIIDRTKKRRLIDHSRLFADLKEALPRHRFQLTDFAALELREQIAVIRDTDVLVGVHGAGLTHSMFLPPGSAVVEYMPFDLEHRGFRNLAEMLGLAYRGAKTLPSVAQDKQTSDWQKDDVEMDPDVYIDEIRNAIEDVRRLRLAARSWIEALFDYWT
jgi:EGF domain-specific O-GlcNAc transferase